MKRIKTREELNKHKNAAVDKLDRFLERKIQSEDEHNNKQADLISYWVEDYVRLLTKEETFKSEKVIHYRKGDIVKMNLGYRVGSEEGGLHYGIVMDVRNRRNCDTVTVIPLTSHKKGKAIHKDDVFIGKELFQAIMGKHDRLYSEIEKELAWLRLPEQMAGKTPGLLDRVEVLQEKLNELEALKKSLLKMKEGSIALVSQVTTISKMRIYDPLYHNNVLYGIRLAPTTVCKIDKKFCELFISKMSECDFL